MIAPKYCNSNSKYGILQNIHVIHFKKNKVLHSQPTKKKSTKPPTENKQVQKLTPQFLLYIYWI